MLLGREVELAALLDSLERKEPVAVVGEAGIGKTTLLRSAVEKAGLPSFEGGGLASLSWLSYLPLARALRMRLPDGDHAAVAAVCVEHVGDGVLLLDDLHWADADTAALLPLLAGRVRLLAGLRRGDPAAARRLEETRRAGMSVVELRALPDETAAALVRERRPDLPDARVRAVVRDAAGNPFLLEELSHFATASETLRLSFTARFERLSAAGTQAVIRLALLGRAATSELAGPGAGEAVEAGLVLAQADGLLVLRHALIGEAALVTLGERERRGLHMELARAIGEPGEAARHHAAAGEREAAYATALMAAAEARHRTERARHLQLAATCAPEREADRLRLSAGLALLEAGLPEEALGLAEAMSGDDEVTAARAAEIKARARFDLDGDREASEAEADAALASLSGAGPAAEARLLLVKARCRNADWDAEASLALADRGLRLLRQAGEPEAAALAMRGLAEYGCGDQGCLAHLAAAVMAARREGDTGTEFEAAFQLASALLDFGKPDAAERAALSLQRRARSLGVRNVELRCAYILMAVEQQARADHGSAIARGRAALEERAALGPYAAHIEALLALALADGGAHQPALDVVEAALGRNTSLAGRSLSSQALLLWTLGEVHWLARRPVDALAAAERNLSLDTPMRLFSELTVAWARRDGADARSSSPPASADAGFGDLEAAVVERDAHRQGSREGFDRAAAAWEGVWLAAALRCRWAAAEAALATGDVADARRRLLELEERLVKLRLVSLLGRVRRSLRKAGVRRSAPRRSGDGSLTAREREVLRLVGEGLTSPQVAARLGIAPGTVDSQVKSAMRKLGARTRRQAAIAVAAD